MKPQDRINEIARLSKIRITEILLQIDPRNFGIFSKYGYYMFVSSLLIFATSMIFLLNGYFHFMNVPKQTTGFNFPLDKSDLLTYLSVFILVAFSPFPDYFIVPFLGYLSYLGFFNLYLVIIISSLADLLLMELDYLAGRFAGRPIVIKFLNIFRVKVKEFHDPEIWIKKHGAMAVFIATFIPFLKHLTSVAAGTLKMNLFWFTVGNFVGFFIRFLLLAYLGYRGVYLLSPNLDFSIRYILIAIALINFAFITYYLANKSINIMEKIMEGIKRDYSP